MLHIYIYMYTAIIVGSSLYYCITSWLYIHYVVRTCVRVVMHCLSSDWWPTKRLDEKGIVFKNLRYEQPEHIFCCQSLLGVPNCRGRGCSQLKQALHFIDESSFAGWFYSHFPLAMNGLLSSLGWFFWENLPTGNPEENNTLGGTGFHPAEAGPTRGNDRRRELGKACGSARGGAVGSGEVGSGFQPFGTTTVSICKL